MILETLLPNGEEIADNEGLIFSLRENITSDGLLYEVVVKTSKKALIDLHGRKMYSVAQVLNHNKYEVFHEVYPSILRETQAKRIINAIKDNHQDFILNGKEKHS